MVCLIIVIIIHTYAFASRISEAIFSFMGDGSPALPKKHTALPKEHRDDMAHGASVGTM